VGVSFAPDDGLLYPTLSGAGRTGEYDFPPLVVVFRVP
jgi:hypothetical protein